MMKPALGCDLGFLRVCSDAKCVCDVANGYARAPDGSCVKGSACQQYFTGNFHLNMSHMICDNEFSIMNIAAFINSY